MLKRALSDVLGGDFDEEAELSDQTSLIYDLGLESLECIALLERLCDAFGFPAESMLGEAGVRVADIAEVTILDMVRFVQIHTASGVTYDNNNPGQG